ncbi:DUF899 domain-containing protein [Amycolatopsis sp.]|uniref:DUF899 domain-containing protein n=1 Tax=Amycolatopsis sp. TaxID=37632 RepID=UPI002C7A2A15|nr:DUF899 domain-containing protein [Amycolatopsis sp.]HVV11767.1 DUF899 domain-containing protein [Amycolatopsis sp.]
MTLPQVASRDEWLAARLKLLAREKELMRAQDELTTQRQELPMVRIDKDYKFAGTEGEVGFADLFEGRRQLVVYHFMFHPDWDEGCPSCSYAVDNIGRLEHLHGLDTTFALVSRAPFAKLANWRKRMDWTVPWYSSAGSDFNYDFHVTNDEAVAPVEYNYKDRETMEREGLGYAVNGDAHGLSVFVRDGEDVFHSYTTYGRGAEILLSTYHYLDLTPLGRQGRYVNQFPYHDTYGTESAHAHHHHHH